MEVSDITSPRTEDPLRRCSVSEQLRPQMCGSGALLPWPHVGLLADASLSEAFRMTGVHVFWAIENHFRGATAMTICNGSTTFWGATYTQSESEPETPSEFATVPKMLREIAECFSLTTSRLAEVARTSRTTVYEWRNGQEPHEGARTRIETLYNSARKWRALSVFPVGGGADAKDSRTNLALIDLLGEENLRESDLGIHLERLAVTILRERKVTEEENNRREKAGRELPPQVWIEETERKSAGRKLREG